MIETIIQDRTAAHQTNHKRGLPKNIDAVFDGFVETLVRRQTEIFERYGAFASCNSICTTKGGPSGVPVGQSESLQADVESIGVTCYVEVIACYNPALGHWYEFDIQWTDAGVSMFQRFFMDGTAIGPAKQVETFGQ